MVSLAGREVETLCHQAHASSSHETLAGVCEPQEWWESGMAFSYTSLRRQRSEGIAIWLLRTLHSFDNVSAAEEVSNLHGVSLLPGASHLTQALPESPRTLLSWPVPKTRCLLSSVHWELPVS